MGSSTQSSQSQWHSRCDRGVERGRPHLRGGTHGCIIDSWVCMHMLAHKEGLNAGPVTNQKQIQKLQVPSGSA